MKPRSLLLFLWMSITLISCDSNRIYEDNVSLKNQEWHRDSIKIFKVQITDTVYPCNIFINCRITGLYPNSNLFLFINTRGPKGLFIRDTLEVILADDLGKWLGKGFGDVWSNQIPFKHNVIFPSKGSYIFELEQATRHRILPAVTDVGIRVEKSVFKH